MTDRDALHRAILDHPAEDEPRLQYADCLEESGRPRDLARAEFIRVQVALARPTTDDHGGDSQARYRLVRREQSLLRKWAAAWLPKPLRAGYPFVGTSGSVVAADTLGGCITFERGFVARVNVVLPWLADEAGPAIERFGAHVRAVFASNPLEAVSVRFEGSAAILTAEITGCVSGPIEDVYWRIGWSEGTRANWPFATTALAVLAPSNAVATTRAGLGRAIPTWLAEATREPAAAVAIDREAEEAEEWLDDGGDWPDDDEADAIEADERDEYRETLADQLGVDPDDIDV